MHDFIVAISVQGSLQLSGSLERQELVECDSYVYFHSLCFTSYMQTMIIECNESAEVLNARCQICYYRLTDM